MTDNTTDLRQRLLLWHRVLAQMSGTLSLSYGGSGLKKSALDEWATRLETVALDMRSITSVANSRLDIDQRAVLRSAARTAPLGHETEGAMFFGKEKRDEVEIKDPAAQRTGGVHSAKAMPKKATRKTRIEK